MGLEPGSREGAARTSETVTRPRPSLDVTYLMALLRAFPITDMMRSMSANTSKSATGSPWVGRRLGLRTLPGVDRLSSVLPPALEESAFGAAGFGAGLRWVAAGAAPRREAGPCAESCSGCCRGDGRAAAAAAAAAVKPPAGALTPAGCASIAGAGLSTPAPWLEGTSAGAPPGRGGSLSRPLVSLTLRASMLPPELVVRATFSLDPVWELSKKGCPAISTPLELLLPLTATTPLLPAPAPAIAGPVVRLSKGAGSSLSTAPRCGCGTAGRLLQTKPPRPSAGCDASD
mmetsp:Transcript_2903/g.11800  ORF Transcript_2903/g.11800 Transcript_2903/m.11800 type:complete len:288 (+) Transcript_2903:1523-2386(+)